MSKYPLSLTKLCPAAAPNSVRSVVPVLDSQNVTLEWPRPDGRIDDYTVVWWRDGQVDRKVGSVILKRLPCCFLEVLIFFLKQL